MIPINEYPVNLGGYSYQEEYKGFNLVVIFKKGEGACLYVIDSEKKETHKNTFPYRTKEEIFLYGRNYVDRHIQFIKEEQEKKAENNSIYYKKKCGDAANLAFLNTCYFHNVSEEKYDSMLGMFKYELENELKKIR